MIRAAKPEDAAEILAIYTPFVTDTAVSFELEPPTVEEMARRIEETTRKYPWLVYETRPHPNPSPIRVGEGLTSFSPLPLAGEGPGVRAPLAGYAYASPHRARAAYQWCVEVSVYVHPEARRSGIARALYTELLQRLRDQGYYNAYAGITLPNPASVGFHESMGFVPVGVYPQIGYKMGRWHDVGWWHLRLREEDGEPSAPGAPRP